jgi:hypothetical protein
MRLKLLVLPCLLVVGTVIMGTATAQEGPPPPTSGELLAIAGALGATIGADGDLYVGEPGTGGDTDVTPPGLTAEEGAPIRFGLTGRIVKVDTDTGAVTDVADGLPSFTFGDGSDGGSGIVDVAFMNGELHFLLTSSPGETGAVDYPNGVYLVEDDGDITLVADIGRFNNDNPVAFPDAVPGGNPFALEVRGSDFIVSDGNYNRILRITSDGDISILAAYDNVVPTGLETTASGPILNTHLGAYPHTPETGVVNRIAFPTGTTTMVASGVSQMIDVEFGPGGQLFAMNFGDAPDPDNPDAEPPPSGRIFRVNQSTGELTAIVGGIAAPTSLDFSGDTAFVTTLLGQIWKIDGVSALQPLPGASPTAVPTSPPLPPPATPTPRGGVISAPDTGTGGTTGGDSGFAWIALPALILAATSLAAAATVVRRAR